MAFLDIPLVQQAAPALEKVVNLALSMDPGSQQRLKPLDGCVLELYFTAAKRSILFKAEAGKVVLLGKHDHPSVTLSGKLITFIKLAYSEDKQRLFRTKEISLSGDAVRAQQIQTLMAKLNIDWEGFLAEFVGDVPAHLLGSTVRHGIGLSKQLGSNFLTDLEEFVKYEVRLLPSRALASRQFDAIDQLRAASDRLEAKLKRMVKQIDGKESAGSPADLTSEE